MIQKIAAADFNWSSQNTAAQKVRDITSAANAADGVVNLNEAAELHLKHQGLTDASLFLSENGYLLITGQNLDLVVHPAKRGNGTAKALLTEALAGAATGLEAWSHANHPAAERLADTFGFTRTRDLLVLHRPATSLPPIQTPGISIRTFTPADAADVLEVNSHAFAQHPEQGHLTAAEFAERTAETWFDPAGLFLAYDGDQILGFHWTKVHRDATPNYGEVYVVAVHPLAAGRGIGKILTHAGLNYLSQQNIAEVILYVDGDNDPAIAVYQASGFEKLRTETQYRR